MITDEDTAIARVLQMAKQGTVQADDGSTVALQADSVCVHGDGPKALAFVQKISAALPAAGVEIKAFLIYSNTLRRSAQADAFLFIRYALALPRALCYTCYRKIEYDSRCLLMPHFAHRKG